MSTGSTRPVERRTTAWHTRARIYGPPALIILAVFHTAQGIATGLRDGFPDFTVFYGAALAWRQGLNPYTESPVLRMGPNTNPPWFQIVLQPLLSLGSTAAGVVWLTCGVLILAWCLWRTSRLTSRPLGALWIACASLDGWQLNLHQGQVAFAAAGLGTGAWIAWENNRRFLSGALLGVLMAWKPFYGVFGLYLLWRADLRALVGAAVGFGVPALSLLAWPAQTTAWFHVLRQVNWHTHPSNVSLYGVTARLFTVSPTEPYITWTVPFANAPWLHYACFAALAVGLIRVSVRALRFASDDRQWAIIAMAGLLLSPLAESNYLLVMVGPLAASLTPTGAALAGMALLTVPFPLIWEHEPSAIWSATASCCYAIGAVLVWWNVAHQSRKGRLFATLAS